MPVSNVCGCVIERDLVYIAQTVDGLEENDLSRLAFYDSQNLSTSWLAHDLPWRTISVCVWRSSPFGHRTYVSLSNEGDVEILGPKANPQFTESIPGAGLNREGSKKKGFMMRIREIGDHLYACGSGQIVFERGSSWKEITDPSSADASAAEAKFYFDINGPDRDDLYAVGPNGPSTSEIAHYDGLRWRKISENITGALTSVAVSRRGGVYVGGSSGVLLYGDARAGFSTAGRYLPNTYILSMAEFDDALFMATPDGLLRLDGSGRTIVPVATRLSPPLSDVNCLDAYDGTLWSFGVKDIAFFDGKTWTRVYDPDNPTP